jgi:isopenicillin-N epimerase
VSNTANIHQPAADPNHWLLDPQITFLNHGSFGACPKPVLEAQSEWRARLEHNPLQFLARDLEASMDAARATLARFIGTETEDLVFVPNATTGVNSVLRSLRFEPGDELLTTNQEYNACRNALNFIAEQSGARVVVAEVPFPIRTADEVIAPILERVTNRTKLALIDHVTSQTALVLPIAKLISEMNARGIETLIDGAHAPGMVALNIHQLQPTYYSGNCHKWLCAPKGAAFLYVKRDKQKLIRPLVISHGANSARSDRSRFLIEFGWTGTGDLSAFLSVPEAIRFIGSLLPGGWQEIMSHNRSLALAARKVLCSALSISEPCPEEFIGSLASIPIPAATSSDEWPRLPRNEYPLQGCLLAKHRIEVPIVPWPAAPKRLLRISAQLYNSLPQYELLTKALLNELSEEASKGSNRH